MPLDTLPRKTISLADISAFSDHAQSILDTVRSQAMTPNAMKTAPTFSSAQVAALCGIDKKQFNYRVSLGELPIGQVKRSGVSRMFTLEETRAWVKATTQRPRRPQGASAVTIAVGNFKGGVSKTTTAMTLAQGLSLKGHNVLVIDLDPQGSLTTLFGIVPDLEVTIEDTVAMMCNGDERLINYAIKETYWDGIHLVPAQPTLYNAEFLLPARQLRERDFKFWKVLDDGLVKARQFYDVIIIDTPPALGYLTTNAFFAADGLLVPLPPSALDYASSVQFWGLFADMASDITERDSVPKTFEFLHILLSRVDAADSAASVVREWIQASYSDKVLPVEIPKTNVTSVTAAEFNTVYDINQYAGSNKTFARAREAYDRVVQLVEQSVGKVWAAHPNGSSAVPAGSLSGGSFSRVNAVING